MVTRGPFLVSDENLFDAQKKVHESMAIVVGPCGGSFLMIKSDIYIIVFAFVTGHVVFSISVIFRCVKGLSMLILRHVLLSCRSISRLFAL